MKKNDTKISLCMIAKDEADFLSQCLRNAKGRVDQIIVVDTGSSDSTVAVAEAADAEVSAFVWSDDFSEARNYSLSQAACEWILVLDCDEVVAVADWERLREAAASGKADAYRVTTRNYTRSSERVGWQGVSGVNPEEERIYEGWFPTTKVRLFRNDLGVRFSGALHELVERQIETAGWTIADCDVPVHHYGYVEKERPTDLYVRVAERKVGLSPQDANAHYELALAHRDCSQFDAAWETIQTCVDLLEVGQDGSPYLDRVLVYLVMGEIAAKLGDHDGERSAYEAALAIDPESFQAMNNLGAHFMKSGDFEAALQNFENARAIAPNIPAIDKNIRKVGIHMAFDKTKSESGRLTLCMIAKNEEDRIGVCLESVQGLVDEIVVVDTGSDDRTVDIAKSFGAKMGYFPWNDNFSDARNESLKLATGDWIIWLDPDDLVAKEMHEPIREAMRQGLGRKRAYFWVLDDQGYEPVTCLQLRLFPNLEGVRFSQPIHEQLTPSLIELGVVCEPTDIRVVHTGYTTPEVVRAKQNRYLVICERWLETNPQDYIVRSHAAQTLYIHGELDKAVRYYKQIIEDSTCRGDHNLVVETTARLFLGRCYIRQEKYEYALTELLQAQELDDQFSMTNLTLGECYMHMGRHDDALNVLELALQHEDKISFLATDPVATKYSIRFGRGENLEAKGLLAEALAAYQEASVVSPRRSGALGAMSSVYRKLGNQSQAVAMLDQARKVDPENLQHAFNRGTLHLEAGEDEPARELLEQVVADEIDLFEPYLNLGYLARRRGDVAEAETYYRKAGTYEDGKFDAHCNLGHLLISDARYQDAYAAFSEARNVKGNVLDVNLGQCVAACGAARHSDVVDPFKAVLSAVYEPQLAARLPETLSLSDVSQLLSESGRMMIEKNLIACTQLAFLGAYLLEPGNLQFGLQLSEVYRVTGEPWKAVQVYEDQIKVYPKEPELFEKLRDVYRELGAKDAVKLCGEHLSQLRGSDTFAQQAC